MPAPLPLGDPAPLDGTLPASVVDGADQRNLGLYLHVPFCRVRCGYCDFNTYTSDELRGAKRSDFADEAITEMRLAAHVMAEAGLPQRPLSTVFFGGGTPTLLPASDLARMLEAARELFGFAPGAEITTEANPDSVDAAYIGSLAAAGFTRMSVGMQSAVPSVLATLERTHNPERVPQVVEWARDAGLDVSLDLIYGTPGETLAQWRESVEQVIALRPTHVSAYSLIVEDGTKMARQIRRGEVTQPDEDLQADMYELADSLFAAAGYEWYEVSNWSIGADRRSRHNLAYWQGQDWWGVGPGAHSHVGGTRWWNVKHPAAYAERLHAGHSPAAGREVLDADTRESERVLLQVRIRDGLPITDVPADARAHIAELIADGLIEGAAAIAGRIQLTLRGRLLADRVVRTLLVH